VESGAHDYDVAIIGGGPAGLQAALTLGRMRRTVVVFDTDDPANAVEHSVSGLLTRDGTPPSELRAIARDQLAAYDTVQLSGIEVVDARREDDGFALELADGGEVRAAKLLIAHGLNYGLPEIPGIAELWGNAAFHCPYCHGWEVRDQRVAVLASTPRAAHQALLLRSVTDRVVVVDSADSVLDEQAQRTLQSAGVEVIAGPVERVDRAGAAVCVRIAGEEPLECGAVFIQVELSLRSEIALGLGARMAADCTIDVDPSGGTGVHGLRAAGDAALPPQSAAHAVGSGALAAYAINAELAFEPFESEPRLDEGDGV
jgi:thioredoxin reductase